MSIKFSRNLPNPQARVSQELSEHFPESFREHQSLREYSAMGVGGVADYFVLINNSDQLSKAGAIANRAKIPYCVFGAGGMILVSDVGYPGLAILNRASAVSIDEGSGRVMVETGARTGELANYLASRGMGGAEYLCAFPGTIGGAVLTDAQFLGNGVRRLVRALIVWLPVGDEGKIVRMENGAEMEDFYRVMVPDIQKKPILLSLELQTTKLAVELCISRLVALRRRADRPQKTLRMIGYPFSPYLPQEIDWRRAAEKELGRELKLNSNPNIIELRKPLVASSLIRDAISRFRLLGEEKLNRRLAERLTYLGYWPNEEGKEFGADSKNNNHQLSATKTSD